MVSRAVVPAQTPLEGDPPRGAGPFGRWPRPSDAILAAVVYLTALFVTTQGPQDDLVLRGIGEVPIGAFFVLAVASGALCWRRSRPVVVLWVTVVAAALSSALDFSE